MNKLISILIGTFLGLGLIGCVSTTASSERVGDFDEDGKSDRAFISGVNSGTTISIEYGFGTKKEVANIPWRDEVYSVEVGDWNKDGHLDIAAICYSRGRERGMFNERRIFYNQGPNGENTIFLNK